MRSSRGTCRRWLYVFVLLGAFGAGGMARASEGILLLGDDPIRVGHGGAGVASPRDASWAMLNPAGLVDLERRLDFGLSLVYARAALHTHGLAQLPFSDEMTDDLLQGIPSFAMVWPMEWGTLGLALNTPTGAAIHFPHPRTWLGVLENDTDHNLDFMQPRLTLAYAHKFDSEWAIGISVNGSLSLARTDQVTPLLLPTRGDNEWDQAFGAGFGVGVYRSWERWSFGAAYESRQWAQVFDTYRDVTPYPVDLPATVQTGIAYRITPKLEIEVDYRFINWSDVKFFHESNWGRGLAWHDQNGVMCGIEWEASPKWTFRAGYSHMTRAMSDEHVFGSALVPNVVQDHAGVGFTRVLSESSELHVTFAHWFEGKQTETGTGDIYSHLGKGTSVGLKVDWLSLGYTWKF